MNRSIFLSKNVVDEIQFLLFIAGSVKLSRCGHRLRNYGNARFQPTMALRLAMLDSEIVRCVINR